MKILITGDLVITQPYYSDNISIGVKNLFRSADYKIVNLEAPVTDCISKIIKTGPHLKANEQSTREVLKSLEIDMVTLANNHVSDYKEQGVLDTMSFCKENNIATIGAGRNKKEASEIFYIETIKGKIAFVNFAENEWAGASETSAGANSMDIIDNTKQINEAKKNADFVFVIIHGGHEYYNLPSPRIQKQYRFYAEQGADIIIAHHTHCIGGHEIYNGTPIFYSLGNMLFTKQSKHKDWYRGIILEVTIDEKKCLQTKVFPIKQKEKNFNLELLQSDEKNELLERFNDYSKTIKDHNKLKINWESFIENESYSYLSILSPKSFVKNKYLRGAINKLGLKLNNKKGNSLLLNMLRCESHRDLSIEILEKYLNNRYSK